MKELIPLLQRILKDYEFLGGGVFTKEAYYMEKYNLTKEQIANIQTCLYYALNVKDDYFNGKINDMSKY